MQSSETPPGMSPVEVVIDLFGGIRSVGRAIGVEGSTVLRWGKTGRIPVEYFDRFLAAAKAESKRLTIEQLVWGTPGVNRTVITFMTPTERPTALGQMAQALSRCSV